MVTLTPIERAIDQVVAVLARQPSGLFTDIDGTISQVARVPAEAFVDESPRSSVLMQNLLSSVLYPSLY